jgi:MFS family permease
MTSPRSPAETRLVLIGAAVLLSLGMGIRQSFGLLLTPVTRDLALTAADFTLAVAVQNIIWGLSQAPVGAIADRFGLRATMMAGAAIGVDPVRWTVCRLGRFRLVEHLRLIGDRR